MESSDRPVLPQAAVSAGLDVLLEWEKSREFYPPVQAVLDLYWSMTEVLRDSRKIEVTSFVSPQFPLRES